MQGEPARLASVAVPGAGERTAERRRSVISWLTLLMGDAACARDPRAARERLEEELRAALRARVVVLREPSVTIVPPAANVIAVDVPVWTGEVRARLDAVFDGPRAPDEWMCQQLEAGAQVAGLLLEIERAQSRGGAIPKRSPDGAAPLIGSSSAIRRVRERIERVAATDFTVLIEGASGPQPHPGIIEVFGEAAVGGGAGEVAGAGKDGWIACVTGSTPARGSALGLPNTSDVSPPVSPPI